MSAVPARAIYEGGGWKDGRLGQAYDLIAEVLDERGQLSFKQPLLVGIESMDEEPHSDGCPARYERNDDCTCGYTATGKVSA